MHGVALAYRAQYLWQAEKLGHGGGHPSEWRRQAIGFSASCQSVHSKGACRMHGVAAGRRLASTRQASTGEAAAGDWFRRFVSECALVGHVENAWGGVGMQGAIPLANRITGWWGEGIHQRGGDRRLVLVLHARVRILRARKECIGWRWLAARNRE